MLLASTSVSSADHPRPLPASSFKNHILNTARSNLALKSIQNPRLRAFPPPSRPRAIRLLCNGDRSGGAGSTAGSPAPEGEGAWVHHSGMEGSQLNAELGSPNLPGRLRFHRMSMGDQAFFLLAFIACTTSLAFTSLVIAAIPTLHAMKKAATSLAKLADTAREELPSTMAAIRLSGMEISDLTLELSDLSQEIADGVSKSVQAVQAADAGIRQIGVLARQQTMSIIQERANLPNISLQPAVSGAAKKTSRVFGQATKTLINFISGGDNSSENDEHHSDKAMEVFISTE